MFRVVSEFVAVPSYLIVCDDPRCKVILEHPLPTDADAGDNPERAVVKNAVKDGWLITLGRHLCPGHHGQMKDVQKFIREKEDKRNGSLIHIPGRNQ